MDKATIENHLVEAERHVAIGVENVKNQRALIVKLAVNGHDTTKAQALLDQFEEAHAGHVADRDRLKQMAAQK